MHDDERLLRELADELRPPDRQPPEDRVRAIRAAAERARAAAAPGAPPRRRPAWLPALRPAGVLALAAIVVVAAALGLLIGRQATDDGPAGTVEYAGAIFGPSGDPLGDLAVRETGIGRVVTLETDALPILPKGELYEVWFVAPDDRPGRPHRISAGTFHPAPDGTTDVRLAAAVDPALFPTLVVTAEPADGDPAPSGDEVLRAPLDDAAG